MEIFELKYFLGVARFENIHRASAKLSVSPGSLSKAVARLEGELGVALFLREGRNIRLTDHGRLLQRRASEIVQLEEDTRLAVGSHAGRLQISIVGPEVLLAEMGMSLMKELRTQLPQATFELQHDSDENALRRLETGTAHLALVTCEAPGMSSKVIAEPHFQTYVGRGHPLHAAAAAKKTVPVAEVLEHAFVSPSLSTFGRVGAKQSADGWRDDQFPRRVGYVTSSLKLLEELVTRGRAVAYLPDYHGERLGLAKLKISGCPYTCVQKIRLVARDAKSTGWLNKLF